MTFDELLQEAEKEEKEKQNKLKQGQVPKAVSNLKTETEIVTEEDEIEALLDKIEDYEEAQIEKQKKEAKSKETPKGRSRVRNITAMVRPEESEKQKAFSQRKEKADAEAKKARKQALKEAKKEAKKADEERRRKEILEKRKARQQRAGAKRSLRFVGLLILLAGAGWIFFLILNFNSGGRHDAKGMDAFEAGDYENAVSEFKEAVSFDSENSDYYTHLGMAYIEMKAYDEALGYFNQAELNAENDEQTMLYLRGRGIAHMYQGNYETAINCFREALNLAMDQPALRTDLYYYMAEAYDKSGDYTGAIDTYSKILDADADAGVYMLRGQAYAQAGHYDQAESDLKIAIKKSKKSYKIYQELYYVLLKQGKSQDASQVLRDALELSGNSGADFFSRGMIYIDLDEKDNAQNMFDKSYKKGYKAALLGKGQLCMADGDIDGAMAFFERYFEETTQSESSALMAKAYNQYAICLMNKGNFEEAAQACIDGLAYNDRESDAVLSMNLISSYEHLGRWDDAYNISAAYAEKYPDDAQGMKEYYFLETRAGQ